MDRLEELFEPSLERLDEIPISAGQKRVGELDDRNLRSEFGIDGAHFEPDIPPTDDEQRVGDLLEFERRSRIHHPGGGEVEGRDPRRPRAAGQDAVIESHRLAPVDADNLERPGGGESRGPLNNADVASLGELTEAAGERRDHLVFAGPEGIELDLRLAEIDAPSLHLPGFSQHPADMEQGLGRDASPQQAGASEPFLALDQRHLHAEIGSQECRGIPTRPTPEHHQRNVRRHRLGLQYG